jgi:L-iditol 2-dehydrogenase
MRSVQLVAPRQLELHEMPEPRHPCSGEVLVRVRAVGICGTDMHWYSDGGIGSLRAVYPQVLGHEPAGEIAALGPGTTDLTAGQKVVIEPTITCGRCEFCRAGRHNNCVSAIFMSSPQMPGLFRDYAVVPWANVIPVPEDMSFAQATLIEPVAVMLHVMELVQIQLGDTVAVLGAGPIGMLTAIMARIAGASRIFIADKVAHRVALAREIAADVAVNTASESFYQAVMDQTRGRGADVVFDAAAVPETIQSAIHVARMGGQLVLIGIPSVHDMRVDLLTAMAKELRIQTIKRSNHNAHAAIALLESGRIPEKIVTHRLPFEKTPAAFEMLAAYADGVGKVVIEMD